MQEIIATIAPTAAIALGAFAIAVLIESAFQWREDYRDVKAELEELKRKAGR